MNVLFVCTGNTCRSPMAAAMMAKISEDNDMAVYCDSAGIMAEAGAPASENARKAARPYGADLSSHRAKQLDGELLSSADLVLAMTEGQKMMLAALGGVKNVYTLGEYSGCGGDVPDPYGGDLAEYEETAAAIYDMLTDAAERMQDEMDDGKY